MANSENFVVGIEPFNNYIKVMKIQGTLVSAATVEYLPFDPQFFTNADYGAMVGETLKAYFEKNSFKPFTGVYFVLPDNLVAIDSVTVPSLKKAQIQESITINLKDMYKNYNDLQMNRIPLFTGKTKVVYNVVLTQKKLLLELYKALGSHKLYVNNCTYASSAALNAVFSIYPKYRKKSFILMDINADHTRFVMCANGTTNGFSSLPFGYNILYSTKVLRETMLYSCDSAYLAVQNAEERAKRIKLSISGEDLESASEFIEENALSTKELSATTAVELVDESDHELNDGFAALNIATEQAEPSGQPEKSLDTLKPAAKTFARKVRRLPLYMQRPIPETQEGIVCENFRIFLKKALLMKQFNDYSEVLPSPEFILVDIPEEFRFAVKEADKQEDNGIRLHLIEGLEGESNAVANNLDLYGALFMKSFNKGHNF